MQLIELGKICEVIAGQSPPSSTYNQEREGLPFFQGKADFGELYPTVRYWCTEPKKISKPNDILFSVRAPVGSTNINNIEASIGRGLSAIRCGEKIDVKFLLHYLRKNERRIADLGTGSTFKAITIKTLNGIKIPLPSLPEQKRIAHLLDQADKLRQLDKQLIEKYDELIQSIFLDMFGDPAINPKGWEKVKLEELTTKLGDGIHGTPKYNEQGEYYFINGNNLINGKILITEKTKKVTKEEQLKHYRELNENTMLVSINGTIGKVAFYNNEKVMLGKSACYFNLKPIVIDKVFLYHLIDSQYFLSYAKSKATGSTIKNVSLKTMRMFPVISPPLPLQTDFANRVTLIEQQKNNVKQALQKSDDLFNCLLQKSFKKITNTNVI